MKCWQITSVAWRSWIARWAEGFLDVVTFRARMKRFASLCEVAAAAASGATGGPSDGAWPGFTAGEITADFVNPARQMHGHAARVLCHFANFADRLAKYSAILTLYLPMTCNFPPSTCHIATASGVVSLLARLDPSGQQAWRMQVH